jgi:regulatory protein
LGVLSRGSGPRSGGPGKHRSRIAGRVHPSEPDSGQNRRSARDTALGLLARREHGSAELRSKLQLKGYDPEEAVAVAENLSEAGLLSDQRFVAAFISQHARRGQGPSRISAELRERGVAAELIETELAAAEFDWNILAAEMRRRKFGGALPSDFAGRAKQARFLQYRGFSTDQIRWALQNDDFAADGFDEALTPGSAADMDDADKS